MPSPFPGMNPYLEKRGIWQDFHESAMPVIRELIAPQLKSNYVAFVNESLYIDDADEPRHSIGRPDVGIADRLTDNNGGIATAPVRALTVRIPRLEPLGLSRVEIRDRDGHSVVTVVELLSPANKKPGPNRRKYLRKRNQYLDSGANLVELDLLRQFPRMPMEGLPSCDYCVLVSRVQSRPDAQAFAFNLRDALPEIPVPLRGNDADVTLDLKRVIDLVHDRGLYQRIIYQQPPEPPLTAEQSAWAKSFIAADFQT